MYFYCYNLNAYGNIWINPLYIDDVNKLMLYKALEYIYIGIHSLNLIKLFIVCSFDTLFKLVSTLCLQFCTLSNWFAVCLSRHEHCLKQLNFV